MKQEKYTFKYILLGDSNYSSCLTCLIHAKNNSESEGSRIEHDIRPGLDEIILGLGYKGSFSNPYCECSWNVMEGQGRSEVSALFSFIGNWELGPLTEFGT